MSIKGVVEALIVVSEGGDIEIFPNSGPRRIF
jgi:hypothetical protein